MGRTPDSGEAKAKWTLLWSLSEVSTGIWEWRNCLECREEEKITTGNASQKFFFFFFCFGGLIKFSAGKQLL